VAAAGRPLEEIGEYVGHTSAHMTDRYRHLIEGQRQEAAAAFDAYPSSTTRASHGRDGSRAQEKMLKPGRSSAMVD
jgi:hypothetical protein